MSIPVVFACGTEVVPLPGGARVRVVKGTHWPASDPVVKIRPELLTADTRFGMFYTTEPDGYDAPVGDTVETATAAPGERRSARRGN